MKPCYVIVGWLGAYCFVVRGKVFSCESWGGGERDNLKMESRVKFYQNMEDIWNDVSSWEQFFFSSQLLFLVSTDHFEEGNLYSWEFF